MAEFAKLGRLQSTQRICLQLSFTGIPRLLVVPILVLVPVLASACISSACVSFAPALSRVGKRYRDTNSDRI